MEAVNRASCIPGVFNAWTALALPCLVLYIPRFSLRRGRAMQVFRVRSSLDLEFVSPVDAFFRSDPT